MLLHQPGLKVLIWLIYFPVFLQFMVVAGIYARSCHITKAFSDMEHFLIYKHNCNYVEFLRRRKFLGRLTQGDFPTDGLLVPLETALDECLHWSGQDMTRKEFRSYLEENDIFTGNLEALQKIQSRTNARVGASRERLKELANYLNVSELRIKPVESGKLAISGRHGYVDDAATAHIIGRTKRHFSGIKRRLSFLPLITDHGFRGSFSLAGTLTPEQASVLRDVLGLKKRPNVNVGQSGDQDGEQFVELENNRPISIATTVAPEGVLEMV